MIRSHPRRRLLFASTLFMNLLLCGELFQAPAPSGSIAYSYALAGIPAFDERLIILGAILIALGILGLLLNAIRRRADKETFPS